MRRLGFLVLAISLLLCGCSDARQNENSVKNFSEKICSAQSVEIQAAISADIGDKRFDFTVLYTISGEEERVEIIKPENLCGVAAVIAEDGTRLIYDDLILAVGSITKNGISPMAALPTAFGAIKNGCFSEVRTESDADTQLTAASFYLSPTQSAELYLTENEIPKYICICEDGKTVAQCEIMNFETE